MDFMPSNPEESEANESKKLVSLLHELFPEEVPTKEWFENERNVPFFLTPPVFSRFDTVHYYNTQNSAKEKEQEKSAKKANIPNTIGRTRQRRMGFAYFVNFMENKVPQKANPEAFKLLRIKFLTEKHYDSIKQVVYFFYIIFS